VAVELVMGRPKAIIKRDVQLNLKLTNFEFEKISKIAEKLKITKTEAILRGIDLLIQNKPKKYKNLNKAKQGQNEPGVVRGTIDDD